MNNKEKYGLEGWLNNPHVDEASKAELRAITDSKELENRFYGLLEFGTAGLRGTLGAGLRNMNIYTVRHATQALADVINADGVEDPHVVIAHDSRIMSREFAEETACVFAANGITAYLFDELRPTPELSFAILELGCIAGVNITASHNPKEYNGYKAYWADGAQLAPEQADDVFQRMCEMDMFEDIKTMPLSEASSKIIPLTKEFDEKYLNVVLAQQINPDAVKANSDLSIIYTPFHGAGYRLVPEVLKRAGFTNIATVDEQMVLDGNFPTVKSPNPENKEGFTRAIEMAQENGADLIIGTDPDADRIGIVVREENDEFITLTGNQTGAILLHYILTSRKETGNLPANAAAVKTIVTSEIAARICEDFGVTLFNVLTGFKFIGEKIKMFEETGKHTFMFGYEESYGYLPGTYARDKDAVAASLLVAEAAAYYAAKNMTLWDALCEIFAKYGNYREKTANIVMTGIDGLKKMAETMDDLRKNPPSQIGPFKVLEVKDYMDGIDGLPASNVLYYSLEGKNTVVIRPSGTEPKIKVYYMMTGTTAEEAYKAIEDAEKAFNEIMGD